jgi:hypothetical protein
MSCGHGGVDLPEFFMRQRSARTALLLCPPFKLSGEHAPKGGYFLNSQSEACDQVDAPRTGDYSQDGCDLLPESGRMEPPCSFSDCQPADDTESQRSQAAPEDSTEEAAGLQPLLALQHQEIQNQKIRARRDRCRQGKSSVAQPEMEDEEVIQEKIDRDGRKTYAHGSPFLVNGVERW